VQLLASLVLLKKAKFIHADIKPENILQADEDAGRCRVKLADFGNMMKAREDDMSPYHESDTNQQPPRRKHFLQSILYRAPEVVLGCQFGPAIDMWSAGCVLAELFTGTPLFDSAAHKIVHNEDDDHLLGNICDITGLLPPTPFASGKFSAAFSSHIQPATDPKVAQDAVSANEQAETKRAFAAARIKQKLGCVDTEFPAFLALCLVPDPAERATPVEAINHAFMGHLFPFGLFFEAAQTQTGGISGQIEGRARVDGENDVAKLPAVIDLGMRDLDEGGGGGGGASPSKSTPKCVGAANGGMKVEPPPAKVTAAAAAVHVPENVCPAAHAASGNDGRRLSSGKRRRVDLSASSCSRIDSTNLSPSSSVGDNVASGGSGSGTSSSRKGNSSSGSTSSQDVNCDSCTQRVGSTVYGKDGSSDAKCRSTTHQPHRRYSGQQVAEKSPRASTSGKKRLRRTPVKVKTDSERYSVCARATSPVMVSRSDDVNPYGARRVGSLPSFPVATTVAAAANPHERVRGANGTSVSFSRNGRSSTVTERHAAKEAAAVVPGTTSATPEPMTAKALSPRTRPAIRGACKSPKLVACSLAGAKQQVSPEASSSLHANRVKLAMTSASSTANPATPSTSDSVEAKGRDVARGRDSGRHIGALPKAARQPSPTKRVSTAPSQATKKKATPKKKPNKRKKSTTTSMPPVTSTTSTTALATKQLNKAADPKVTQSRATTLKAAKSPAKKLRVVLTSPPVACVDDFGSDDSEIDDAFEMFGVTRSPIKKKATAEEFEGLL
jgi:serine/threonine protein kinase